MNAREKEKIVTEAAKTLGTDPERLLETIKRFQKEIEEFEKEIKGS